jgi:dynamin 1-like protein
LVPFEYRLYQDVNHKMDCLIPVVNKLQDVFGAIGQQSIDLPQIVVVGSQSEGKSSVLEAVVGRDFLPRGLGVVTRRPLILQLYCIDGADGTENNISSAVEENSSSSMNGVHSTPQSNSSSSSSSGKSSSSSKKAMEGSPTNGLGEVNRGEEWGEFLHLPGQRFYDFTEIRAEIARETERVTGKNKGISSKSINLKIFSPHVLNLTLVDLPGITKVPTGDQPEDVEEQIRSMCYEFTSNPNAIILAVTAANHDIVNSDGLKMARAVDPDGERTVGVLTKVDIMDKGTDCSEVLANKVVPLRRGYIAVVNRSQKDIQDGLAIRTGLSNETTFFHQHPKYRNMLAKCGTANLARTLNQILMLHIRDCLPDIKSRIMGMMATVQSNIEALGEPTDDSAGPRAKGATLLQILSKFARSFDNSIEGRGAGSGACTVEMDELCGGARISYIFNDIFGKSLKQLSPFEGLSDDDIRTAIANANGPRPSLFVPEIAFDLLVKKQIEKLLQPGLQCVDLVFDEMQRIAFQCENQELSRFPELRDRLYEIVQQQLRASILPTQKMISNLISVELAYINTSHPDFIGGKQAVAQLNKRFAQQQQREQQQRDLQQRDQQSAHAMGNSDASNKAGKHSSAMDKENVDDITLNLNRSKFDSVSSGDNNINNSSKGGDVSRGGGFFNLFKPSEPTPGSIQNNNMLGRSFEAHQQAVIGHVSMRSGSNHMKGSRDPGLIRLPNVPDKMKSGGNGAMTDRERVETEIIKTLLSSYFDIVKKNFLDLVPKTVMHFLVNAFKESLQNELVKELYKEEIMVDLMKETADVASRRKACREMKELLRRGLEIVNEVRDFTFM